MLVCQRWEQVNFNISRIFSIAVITLTIITIISFFTTVIITLTIIIVVKGWEGKIC